MWSHLHHSVTSPIKALLLSVIIILQLPVAKALGPKPVVCPQFLSHIPCAAFFFFFFFLVYIWPVWTASLESRSLFKSKAFFPPSIKMDGKNHAYVIVGWRSIQPNASIKKKTVTSDILWRDASIQNYLKASMCGLVYKASREPSSELLPISWTSQLSWYNVKKSIKKNLEIDGKPNTLNSSGVCVLLTVEGAFKKTDLGALCLSPFFLSRWEAGFCNGSKLQFKKKKLIVLIECV